MYLLASKRSKCFSSPIARAQREARLTLCLIIMALFLVVIGEKTQGLQNFVVGNKLTMGLFLDIFLYQLLKAIIQKFGFQVCNKQA